MGGVASAQGEIRKVHILKPEGKTSLETTGCGKIILKLIFDNRK